MGLERFFDRFLRPGDDKAMFSGLLINLSTHCQSSIAASSESKLNPITFLWSAKDSSICQLGNLVGWKNLTSWKTHCMERWARNLVIWQIIDRVFPQSKARPSLCQHERHTWRSSTSGGSFIKQQDWNSSIHQTPIFLSYSLVKVC